MKQQKKKNKEEHLTKKQQIILLLLARYRFLTSTHIQSFINHKQKRESNRLLKDITDRGYISRIYDSKIIGKNRVSAIYFLANKGIRCLKDTRIYNDNFIHALYWDKKRSITFIDHCLMITTICTQLEDNKTKNIIYKYAVKSDFSDEDRQLYFLKSYGLTTDLCFSKTETGKDKCYFLVELFDERFPTYRLRKRLRTYIDFYFSNEWENNMDSTFPQLMFIFQTKERMIYTKRYIKKLQEDNDLDDLSFNFATMADVQELGITGAIWE